MNGPRKQALYTKKKKNLVNMTSKFSEKKNYSTKTLGQLVTDFENQKTICISTLPLP